MGGCEVPSVQQGRSSISEAVCATLAACNLESPSPCCELPSLSWCTMDGGKILIIVREVEVQI